MSTKFFYWCDVYNKNNLEVEDSILIHAIK